MSSLHVICYHRILPVVSGDERSVDYYHSRRNILHSLADFRSQLDLVQRECDVLDAVAFMDRRHRVGTGRPAVLLTFDDGYWDFDEIVLPELSSRGLPCVLFPTKAPVVSRFVPPADKVYAILAAADSLGTISSADKEGWVSGPAKKALLNASPEEQVAMISQLLKEAGIDSPAATPAHLTEERLRSLPSSVYLGAHGLFHHEFGSLSPAQLQAELLEILTWVRFVRPDQAAGVWLAYPNGRADRPDNPKAVTDAVNSAGVDLAFTAHASPMDAKRGDDLLIPRLFSKNGVDWLAPVLR